MNKSTLLTVIVAAAVWVVPMIIAMDNLNAVKPGESAALYLARGASRQAAQRAGAPAAGDLSPVPYSPR